MKLINILFITVSLSLVSCGGKKDKGDKININSLLEENSEGNKLEISPESLDEIIGSIPSPIEVAMVIKQSSKGFNEGLLNLQDNSELYTTDQEKAMGIGIYSGDLGYINIYEKSHLTVSSLGTIKKLADDINIGHFFDFSTIKRMASNSDKMDSLIFLTTVNFNKMDAFLRNQKRSNLSVLMITGTWTEGLFIATQDFKNNKNKDIMEWVGYQKVIVDQLLLALSAYKDDAYFQKMITDMSQLKGLYDSIKLVYEYHEPESTEVDGRLVIVDKSTSTVIVTPEQVDQIGAQVEKMRTRLVNNI
jgi:hypothetical protein